MHLHKRAGFELAAEAMVVGFKTGYKLTSSQIILNAIATK